MRIMINIRLATVTARLQLHVNFTLKLFEMTSRLAICQAWPTATCLTCPKIISLNTVGSRRKRFCRDKHLMHRIKDLYHTLTWPQLSFVAEDTKGRIVGYILAKMSVNLERFSIYMLTCSNTGRKNQPMLLTAMSPQYLSCAPTVDSVWQTSSCNCHVRQRIRCIPFAYLFLA